MPPAAEACDFMLGEAAQDFVAFAGPQYSAAEEREDAAALIARDSSLATAESMLDRPSTACAIKIGEGDPAVFVWAPIEAEERDAIIVELSDAGLEGADAEGGAAMADPEASVHHLVTNAGWYFSTEERGALYLRTVFED